MSKIDIRDLPENTLKYYQARSEIDDVTAKYDSCDVFHSRKQCQKEFPDSEIIEMLGDHIQLPSFVDIPTIVVQNRFIAEGFCIDSGSCFDTSDYLDKDEGELFDYSHIIAVYSKIDDLRTSITIAVERSSGNLDDETLAGINDVVDAIEKLDSDIFVIFWGD